MSIKYLLPKEGKFYKANLHCHSTNSDGRLTPEQIKQQYKAEGYSVVAITEHEHIFDYSYLNDEDFLTITGYEVSVSQPQDKPSGQKKTTHLNFFAQDPHCDTHVAYDPRYAGNVSKYAGPIYNRQYTIESKNYMIEQANKNGFIVGYNHPAWSLESPEEILPLKGLFSVEIYNHISETEHHLGYSPETINAFAEAGYDVGCIAADDNHNLRSTNCRSAEADSFGGVTYIKAKEFTYSAIYNALKNKEFYASTGAQLYDLYLDGRTVYVKCSPCQSLYILTGGRQSKTVIRESDEITEAAFELDPKTTKYIRVVAKTTTGKFAFSKAYFVDFD